MTTEPTYTPNDLDAQILGRAAQLLECSLDTQDPATAAWARAEIAAGRTSFRPEPLGDGDLALVAVVGGRDFLRVDLRALGFHYVAGEILVLDVAVDDLAPE